MKNAFILVKKSSKFFRKLKNASTISSVRKKTFSTENDSSFKSLSIIDKTNAEKLNQIKESCFPQKQFSKIPE